MMADLPRRPATGKASVEKDFALTKDWNVSEMETEPAANRLESGSVPVTVVVAYALATGLDTVTQSSRMMTTM